jgi:hypothetical protein
MIRVISRLIYNWRKLQGNFFSSYRHILFLRIVIIKSLVNKIVDTDIISHIYPNMKNKWKLAWFG